MAVRTQAAVVRRRGGAFAFESVRIEEPRPDELLVRIVACGICHTDIAARDGLLGMRIPAVFGHEGAGIVEKTGAAITRVRPGDSVLLSFSSCGKCSRCSAGHPAHCAEFDTLNFGDARRDGSPTIRDAAGKALGSCFLGQSSLARHALTRERNAIVVEGASEDQLAVFAPLGCGVQAGAATVLNELKPRPGQSLVVFGAGAVGLSAVMAARLAGASPIVAVDIVPSRLELARKLGASVALDARKEDIGARLREVAGEVDHAVETTGASRVIDRAVKSLAPRGRLSLLGVSSDSAGESVTPSSPAPGQSVFYSIAGDSDPQKFLPFLIERYREGEFPVNLLIREYPAAKINEAVRDSTAGTTVKPVLRF